MRPLILRRKPWVEGAKDAPKNTPKIEIPEYDAEPEQSIAVKAARAAMAARAAAPSAPNAPSSQKAKTASHTDPSPSRTAYRVERLMLTPFFRVFLRVGAPLMVSFIAGMLYFGDDGRRMAISAGVADFRTSIQTRPEFMVQLVAINGASPEVDQMLRERFPLTLPISSFDLDLELLQAEMAELDVIQDVSLYVRPGGVLEINLTERQPAVVWRSRAGIVLLDKNGIYIRNIEARNLRGDLPLLAGEGAQDFVAEALELIHTAAPVGFNIRGLVRVGQRRWDIELIRNQRLMLPENDPLSALQQIIALDQAQDLLARDLVAIDMRTPQRPTLRMAKPAVEDMRRIKAIEMGEPLR